MRAWLKCGGAASVLVCAQGVGQSCLDPWLVGPPFPHAVGGLGSAVSWDPDGAGPLDETLVVSGFGSIPASPACSKVAIWDGTNWQPLGDPPVVPEPLAVIGGQLYGGSMRWNGSSWEQLGAGLNSVVALAEWNGNPVAAGRLTLSDTTVSIFRWNGAVWEVLANTDAPSNISRVALAVFGGELIAAGPWSTIGGQTIRGVARFDGANWSPIGAGVASGTLNSAAVVGGALYVGGLFTLASPAVACAVAKWDGSAWTKYGPTGLTPRALSSVGATPVLLAPSCGDGCSTTVDAVYTLQSGQWKALAVNGPKGDIYSLATLSDGLAAVGLFVCVGARTWTNSPADIAIYRSQRWGALTAGFNGSIYSTLPFEGGLVVAGQLTQAPGNIAAARIVRWDGDSWAPMGEGLTVGGGVSTLAVFNGKLYAGGEFLKSGATILNYAAMWNGSSWQVIGNGGFNGPVYSLAAASDRMYAWGSFSHAGGLLVNGLAQFVGGSWYSIPGRLSGGGSIAVHQDVLYIAGAVATTSGTFTGIVKSQSGIWSSIAPQASGTMTQLASDGQSLWVSGQSFKITPADAPSTAARWNGSTWQSFGVGAGRGRFVMHGGVLHLVDAAGIYRWNGSEWNTVALRTSSDPLDVISAASSFSGEIVVGGYAWGPLGSVQLGDAIFDRWNESGVPGFLAQPQPVTIDPGQQVALSVSIMGGYEPLGGSQFQWRRNGEPLVDGASPGGGQISGVTGATLTIESAAASDSGFYDCIVSTDCGSRISETARVLVGPPCGADLNNDGFVDDSDFTIFVLAYEILDCAAPGMPAGCPADLNSDGFVEDSDFSLFVAKYDELICP